MAILARFSEEEKEEDRRYTLSMLREGRSQAEISRYLGRSQQYILLLKKELIAQGLITQDEIDKARKSKLKKNQKKAPSSKAIKKESRIKAVLEGIKAGKTESELIKQLGIPRTTLGRYIDELLRKGEIQANEIIDQREKILYNARQRNEKILNDYKNGEKNVEVLAKKYEISESYARIIINGYCLGSSKSSHGKKKKLTYDNPNIKLNEKQERVLDYLKKGYTDFFIEKSLELSHEEFLKIKNHLKKLGVIDSEQIRKSRDEKKAQDEIDVLNLLQNGCEPKDILGQHPEFCQSYLSGIVTGLKKKNLLSDAQIKEAGGRSIKNLELEGIVLKGMKDRLNCEGNNRI